MNFKEFCERALKAKRKNFYKYKNYYIVHEGNLVTLKHYYSSLVTVNKEGKIVYADEKFSYSDKRSTYIFTKVFQELFNRKVEYEFIGSRIYYGEELENLKERRKKFRKSFFNKILSFPDAFPLLQNLGFEVVLVLDKEWSRISRGLNNLYTYFNQNKLYLRIVDGKERLVVTHLEQKTLKVVYFSPNTEKIRLLDVRLAGVDSTGQAWSLRLPLGYYLASIETCERWLMGLYGEYEVVQEQ